MFYYKVDFWHNYDHSRHNESGILVAKNYVAAMQRVKELYESDEVISVYLEEWDDFMTEDELLDAFSKADVKA